MNGSSWGELESLRRQLGVIAEHLQHARVDAARESHCWQPAVNVYRCADEYIVCVELAGVDRPSLRVLAEPQRLTVRGRRLPPEPADGATLQVLAMEIDYGPFERELAFPSAIDVTRVEAELDRGLVWIRLPVSPEA